MTVIVQQRYFVKGKGQVGKKDKDQAAKSITAFEHLTCSVKGEGKGTVSSFIVSPSLKSEAKKKDEGNGQGSDLHYALVYDNCITY